MRSHNTSFPIFTVTVKVSDNSNVPEVFSSPLAFVTLHSIAKDESEIVPSSLTRSRVKLALFLRVTLLFYPGKYFFISSSLERIFSPITGYFLSRPNCSFSISSAV